jgi:hypothetical protein
MCRTHLLCLFVNNSPGAHELRELVVDVDGEEALERSDEVVESRQEEHLLVCENCAHNLLLCVFLLQNGNKFVLCAVKHPSVDDIRAHARCAHTCSKRVKLSV